MWWRASKAVNSGLIVMIIINVTAPRSKTLTEGSRPSRAVRLQLQLRTFLHLEITVYHMRGCIEQHRLGLDPLGRRASAIKSIILSILPQNCCAGIALKTIAKHNESRSWRAFRSHRISERSSGNGHLRPLYYRRGQRQLHRPLQKVPETFCEPP